MPGSKRTFSYTLTPPPEDTDRVLKQAQKVMAWACDGDPRIDCHDVTGEALGTVVLSATVHGRDRWATTQIMQDVLNLILWGLRHPKDLDMDLRSVRPEPHTHRGYAYGRTKTYREPRPPKGEPGLS
jgi:hypothetical protein